MAEEELEDRDWPELLSDTSVVGGAGHGAGLPRLKRGQGSRHLGVDMTFNPDDKEGMDQRNKHFTSSGKQSSCTNHLFTHFIMYMKHLVVLLHCLSQMRELKSKLLLFSLTDEDLIKHILADGQNFFPQADESEMADL